LIEYSIVILSSSFAAFITLYMRLLLVHFDNLLSICCLLRVLVITHTYKTWEPNRDAFDCICHASGCLMHRTN